MSSTAPRTVDLGTAHYKQRVAQIAAYADGKGFDGILLLNSNNVMWACGFFHIPNERPLGLYVSAKGNATLFVPFLEREQAEANWVGDVRTYWEYPGHEPAEAWMLRETGAARVALDSGSFTLITRLQAQHPQLVVDSGVARMRYLKTEAEIALTEAAAGYADYALEVARASIADGLPEGITEIAVVRAVQAATTARMQRELAELTNFYRGAVSLTVHTGARAALPHGQPGPVALRPGDTVIVGVGAKVGGYHAESGCTFVIGQPSAEQLRCLEATWACDEAAFAALRPGATCEAVNAAGLAVLRERGFGGDIRHRIGHGMGLEGHEAPWLSDGDATVLAPSMVFSNEPGIYRPGIDGYRIIDSMVVTTTGGRRLSQYLSTHGPEDRVIAA